MNKDMNYASKDGTTATKEEERAALAKIKKIIEGRGPGRIKAGKYRAQG